jgi:hypothetical protein
VAISYRRLSAAVALALLVAATAIGSSLAAGGTSPPRVLLAEKKLASQRLSHLRVRAAAPMAGYSRDRFGPAWEDIDHNGCDTRNDILRRDLVRIRYRSGSDCLIATGILHDPYTGKTIRFVRGVGTSTAVQIDHVVALADAWRTGARTWSPAKRLRYANDPLVLLAVDGPENESKSDDDASEWLPPRKAYDCRYVVKQIAIKTVYALWVTPGETTAMRRVLAHCS